MYTVFLIMTLEMLMFHRPRLTSPYCNEPYAAPLPIEEAAAAARYGRVRDEEEAVSLGRGEDRNVGFELNEIRS